VLLVLMPSLLLLLLFVPLLLSVAAAAQSLVASCPVRIRQQVSCFSLANSGKPHYYGIN